MATFVSGFIVGFTAAWKLALVTLAVVPLIAVIGGLCAAVLSKLSSRSQDELSKASNIAEQVIHFSPYIFKNFVTPLGLLF
jgi:ATP-binding cassette, subfamily B (MDR/TAP), member 1